MKLVHAADLHLDSPLRGLDRYEHAPVERVRGATRRAMDRLVGCCIAEGATALLLAGDLFDGDWKDYGTGLYFSAKMTELREAGIRVFLVRGNHDAASKISRNLRYPENVRELSFERPETVVVEELGLAVHGQSFESRDVLADLAARYPEPVAGALNVGLLHTALDGREGHAPYAPTSVSVLESKGYDYWALGHVHTREVVSERPWIVFPGNLQGRHARETGAKGATVVSVEGGRVTHVTHCALDVLRWEVLSVDASEASSGDDVMDSVREVLDRAVAAADGRLLAVRVQVHGASRAHGVLWADPLRWESQLRALATDAGDVWLERVRLETSPFVDLATLAGRDDAVGHLARALRGVQDDPLGTPEVTRVLDELRRRLPAELLRGDDALRLDDPEFLREVLADVERAVLPALVAESGADP